MSRAEILEAIREGERNVKEAVRIVERRASVDRDLQHTGWKEHGPVVIAFSMNIAGFSPGSDMPFNLAGQHFDTPLRYLSFRRAVHYGMGDIANRVLDCHTSAEAVQLARTVGPELDPAWNKIADMAMQEAYLHRFIQNPGLTRILAATRGKRIAFAGRDGNWSCGLDIDNPDISLPARWRGKNRLGEILTGLRDEGMKDLVAMMRLDFAIDAKDKQAMIDACRYYMHRANHLYGLNLPPPDIAFGLRGGTGGRAWYMQHLLEFNPVIMAENFDEYITVVAPHEIAHLVQYQRYGEQAMRAKQGHGKEWQQIMHDFGLPAERYHAMSVVNTENPDYVKKIWTCGCPGQAHITAGNLMRPGCPCCGKAMQCQTNTRDFMNVVMPEENDHV